MLRFHNCPFSFKLKLITPPLYNCPGYRFTITRTEMSNPKYMWWMVVVAHWSYRVIPVLRDGRTESCQWAGGAICFLIYPWLGSNWPDWKKLCLSDFFVTKKQQFFSSISMHVIVYFEKHLLSGVNLSVQPFCENIIREQLLPIDNH